MPSEISGSFRARTALRAWPLQFLLIALLATTALLPLKTEAATTLSKPANNLGLVGYWSFNEGTSTVATDFSGNGNTGTLTDIDGGIPTWVSGKRGKALNFDQGEVQASQSTSLNGNGSTATISFWVKAPTPTESFGQVIVKYGGSSGWQVQTNDTGPNMYLRVDTSGGANQTPCSSSALTNVYDNQWHHIVFILNAGTCASYKDGIAGGAGPYTVGSGFANTSTLVVRKDNGSAGTYVHTMDDVRIYNRALTAAEVARLAQAGAVKFNSSSVALQQGSTLANGLVGHWTFDGPDVTTTVTDRSSSNNHGYFIGGATSSAKTISKLGQALQFDGVDDRVLESSITFTSSFSFAAWVYLNQVVPPDDQYPFC